MLIELTDAGSKKKSYINSVDIIGMGRFEDYSILEFNSEGSNWRVKETPQQIQELIMLDEFAKVAMGAFLSSPSFDHSVTMGMVARDAYSQAHAMIDARREALK